MSMQDRDYYREWLREKEGIAKKKPFQYLKRQHKKVSEAHPLLTFLAVVFISLFVYGILKIVLKLGG